MIKIKYDDISYVVNKNQTMFIYIYINDMVGMNNGGRIFIIRGNESVASIDNA